MLDIVQDKIRIRTMASDDAAVLLKWMTDMRVLEFYEGRDKRYKPYWNTIVSPSDMGRYMASQVKPTKNTDM